MEQLDFLAAVLPSEGHYCTFAQKNNFRKNIFDVSLDGLYTTNLSLSDSGKQAYFALSTFTKAGSREAVNAQLIKALFCDLDCGPAKAFADKRSAVEAVYNFIQTTGLDALGSPWLVDSGGGVHVYWPFHEAVSIDEWRPVAESLKQAARANEFPIDYTVTADAARVLRMPGTMNHKYTPSKPVMLRHRGDVFDFAALAAKLRPYAVALVPRPTSTALAISGERPTAAKMSPLAAAVAGDTVQSFKRILERTRAGKGCDQLAFFIQNAQEDGMEPLWRALITVAKPCEDGWQAARKLSSLHPYDDARLQSKWDASKGPVRCAVFNTTNPGVCAGCPNYGKLATPLQLGRVIEVVETPLSVEPKESSTQDQNASQAHTGLPNANLPTPPRGFSYTNSGAIVYTEGVGDEAVQHVVSPYPVYPTNIFREEDGYKVEICAHKPSRVVSFAIPMQVMSEPKACLKALAGMNVLASGADQHLYRFLKGVINATSAQGDEVDVPETMGWQKDGSFVIGEDVYRPGGSAYKFKSNRLDNLIEHCRPKGTLDGGLAVLNMMLNKARKDPTHWGHVAAMIDSLASPLARFAPTSSASSTLHVCGKESGGGKTLVLFVSAAFWGNPQHYILSAGTSAPTTMQRAGMLNGMPLLIDELTDVQRATKGEWIPKLAFAFSDGKHKTKGSNVGNREISQREGWCGYMQMSSNLPVMEFLAGVRAGTSEGEMRRIIEWKLEDGWALQWTEEERAVLPMLEQNYGMVGRVWAQYLIPNKSLVMDVRAQCREIWLRETQAHDDERFWTEHVVNNLTTAVLLARDTSKGFAGLIDIPLRPLLDFWKRQVTHMRSVMKKGRRNAMDLFNAFMQENNARFVVSMPASSIAGIFKETPVHGEVVGRIERDTPGTARHLISERMLRAYCSMQNFSFDSFCAELSSKFPVSMLNCNLNKGTGGPIIRTRCLCVDVPDTK